MIVRYYPRFKDRLRQFPKKIRERFYKQADFLIKDLRHPSLHAKKYGGVRNVWQARVDKNIRFYFLIEAGAYIFLDIIKHPK